MDESTRGAELIEVSIHGHEIIGSWLVNKYFPFTISRFRYKNNDKLKLAQYEQSKLWVQYGKSDKRVKKHQAKIDYFEENYPEELI